MQNFQIILGGEDGRMRIIDINKSALVREFPSDKNFNSKITVLVQSTAVDVIAVGLADGRIHLRNIEVDRVLFSFQHGGCITALSFRFVFLHIYSAVLKIFIKYN